MSDIKYETMWIKNEGWFACFSWNDKGNREGYKFSKLNLIPKAFYSLFSMSDTCMLIQVEISFFAISSSSCYSQYYDWLLHGKTTVKLGFQNTKTALPPHYIIVSTLLYVFKR